MTQILTIGDAYYYKEKYNEARHEINRLEYQCDERQKNIELLLAELRKPQPTRRQLLDQLFPR